MFIPLGISLALIIKSQRSYLRILIASLMVGMITSTTVEVTQLFLTLRVSNFSDIVCNSLGSCLGATLYYWHQEIIKFALGLLTLNRSKLSLKSIVTAIAIYCSLVFFATWLLLVSVNLSNWDDNYYLALGNEVTGDRPWNGYIDRLYICDRSLDQSEIAAAFKQNDSFLVQSPNLLFSLASVGEQNYDLFWQRSLSLSQFNQKNTDYQEVKDSYKLDKNQAIYLNQSQWLKTKSPAIVLNQRLKNSSELSLFIKIKSKNISQTGPARILSLSNGIYAQNLLVGQDQKNLNFRIRTPITGDAPTQPEFVIPDVFDSDNYLQVIITFASNKLNFYVDNLYHKYSYEFTPANSFISYLPWNLVNWTVNLTTYDVVKYQLVFYLIIIIPFIILILVLIYYLLFNNRAI